MFEIMRDFDWMLFLRYLSPMLVLVVAALVLMVRSVLIADDDEVGFEVPSAITILALVISFLISWYFWPKVPNMMISTLYFDRAVFIGWMVVVMATLFVVLISINAVRESKITYDGYFTLVLMSAFGMGIVIAAANLITLLIGLEIMSIALYALVVSVRKNDIAVEAGVKYFLMGGFASAFFLMGLAFIFGSVGTCNLSMIAQRAPEISNVGMKAFYMFGVAMLLIGFGFKITIVPFHAWAPDTYDGASTPVTTFLATASKAAVMIAFTRFALAAAGTFDINWYYIMWGLAAITMLYASLAAIRQYNLKRMLAYSSIVHTGFMLLLFPSAALDHAGVVKAMLFYLVSYVIMNIGAFAVVSTLVTDSSEEVEINRLAGLAKRRPFLAAALSLFLISLAGFPPTIGFFAKYYLFLAAIKNGDIILVIVAVVASVISIYYYLRPVVVMYFREETEVSGKMPFAKSAILHPAVVAVLVLAVMAVIFFGIFPNNLVELIQASI